jgi:hypothetical protein
MQPGLALDIEASHPPVGALTRDAHRPGDMGDRHVLITDPLHEQTPTKERQSSITVTHEDLRVVKTAISTAPEVFNFVNDQSPT